MNDDPYMTPDPTPAKKRRPDIANPKVAAGDRRAVEALLTEIERAYRQAEREALHRQVKRVRGLDVRIGLEVDGDEVGV